jgi:hypothetical protein
VGFFSSRLTEVRPSTTLIPAPAADTSTAAISPSSNTPVSPATPGLPASEAPGYYVRALYRFDGAEAAELSLSGGECILVKQRDERGWAFGTVGDRAGWSVTARVFVLVFVCIKQRERERVAISLSRADQCNDGGGRFPLSYAEVLGGAPWRAEPITALAVVNYQLHQSPTKHYV